MNEQMTTPAPLGVEELEDVRRRAKKRGDVIECRLLVTLDAERARAGAAEERLKDAVFNCPSCGRHDFGLLGPQIADIRCAEERADAAEQRVATLEAAIACFNEILPINTTQLIERHRGTALIAVVKEVLNRV